MIEKRVYKAAVVCVVNQGVLPLLGMTVAKIGKGYTLTRSQQVYVTIAIVGMSGVISNAIGDYYIQVAEDVKEGFEGFRFLTGLFNKKERTR